MSSEARPRRRRRRGSGTAEGASADATRLPAAALGVLLVLALLAAFQGWNAARSALRIKTLEAELRQLERVNTDVRLPTLSDLRERFVDLGLPAQPAEAELRARYWWLLARLAPGPAERVAALREARTLLRGALAERAGWPYTWLMLAQVEYALAPRERAGAIALAAALDIGVRGLLLQKQMLEVWQQVDPHLEPGLRMRLEAALRIGIRDHGFDLARELRHSVHLHWVCGDPENYARVPVWCADQGWPEPH